MRELRTLGSVRGVSGNWYPYRDPRPVPDLQPRGKQSFRKKGICTTVCVTRRRCINPAAGAGSMCKRMLRSVQLAAARCCKTSKADAEQRERRRFGNRIGLRQESAGGRVEVGS